MSSVQREWSTPSGAAGSRLHSVMSAWRGWRSRSALHTLFVQREGLWAWPPAMEADGDEQAPSYHDSVSSWMQQHEGASARLVLSGALLHHLILRDPRLPLHDETSVAEYARHQFVHYHGSGAQNWALAPWCESEQRGVCALHGLDLGGLMDEAQRCKIRLRSITPWWALALRAAQRVDETFAPAPLALLLLAEGRVLTCLTSSHGSLVDVDQRRLDESTLAAAQAGALEWQGEQADRRAATVLLTGYGLSVAHTNPADLAPMRVLGDVVRLEANCPHRDWMRA